MAANCDDFKEGEKGSYEVEVWTSASEDHSNFCKLH